MQIGDAPEVQTRRQFVLEETPRMFQRLEGLFLLTALDRDLDVRRPHVGRYFGAGHVDSSQTRVVHLETDQLRQFFLNRFGNAPGTVFFHLQPLRLDTDQHRTQQTGGLAFDRLQYFFRKRAAGRNHGHGYDRAVVQIHVVDFRHRNVELVAQPVLEAFYDMPFFLEGMRVFDPELQREHAYRGHYADSFATLCITNASMRSPCLTS